MGTKMRAPPSQINRLVETIKRRAKLQGTFTAVYVNSAGIEEVQVSDVASMSEKGLVGLYSEEVTSVQLREDIESYYQNYGKQR